MSEFIAVCYEVGRLSVPHEKLIVYIKNSALVEDWNSPFDGLMIIQTAAPVSKITEVIYEFLGSRSPFFVMVMAQGEIYGAVPTEVWNWFQRPREGFKISIAHDANGSVKES